MPYSTPDEPGSVESHDSVTEEMDSDVQVRRVADHRERSFKWVIYGIALAAILVNFFFFLYGR